MMDPQSYDSFPQSRRAPDAAGPAPHSSGIDRELGEREALEANLEAQAEQWRDEVASRVEGYRSRRSKKRLSGEYSMTFDFDSPSTWRPASVPRAFAALTAPVPQPEPPIANAKAEPAPDWTEFNQFAEPQLPSPSRTAALPDFCPPAYSDGAQVLGVPEPPASERPPAVVRTSPPPRETKIIEFPRSLVFPEFAEPSFFDSHELAEPITDAPRILDVPDTVPVPAPPLANVALEGEVEEDPAPAPAFDLPLQVAPLPHRVIAALLDSILVLVAIAAFAMIVLHGVTALPHSKPFIAFGLAVPLLFWAVYHYLFLVHTARTPGMQITRLRLSTFEGDRVPQYVRRWRALLMVLSCASLGFGFLWALIDEDNLCWHDKMTRTYLTLGR